MANYSILFSPTGGTRRVAEILTQALGGSWQEVNLCREIGEMDLGPEDVCLVSVPSYGGRVPFLATERLGSIHGNGARAVLVCVYGNRAWEDTLTELQDTLEHQGFRCAGAVSAVAEHTMFRQFAAGRPDGDDAEQLREFALKLARRLAEDSWPPLKLEGSHGTYKHFPGAGFKPQVLPVCTGCGICAAECPIGAIPLEEPGRTDLDKCIGCLRCVAVCPEKARQLDPAAVERALPMFTPRLSGHKENYLFL